jgi:hypothetical protein
MMATTAVEKPKTRATLAQMAGRGQFSLFSTLAGVLVGYSMFALLLGGTAAVLHHNGSKLDLTERWDTLSTRGGLLLGGLLFVSYLFAGYVAGRMAWRNGTLHGLAVFIGSLLVVGAVALLVRKLTDSKDIKGITDALRSFGVPITRDEWRNVGSVVGIASLAGMLLGSLLGGAIGGRWYTKVSRRALATELDVRERFEASDDRPASADGARNGHRNGTNGAREGDIDELTKDELYQLAQEQEIPGRSNMTKDELKEAVQHQS